MFVVVADIISFEFFEFFTDLEKLFIECRY